MLSGEILKLILRWIHHDHMPAKLLRRSGTPREIDQTQGSFGGCWDIILSSIFSTTVGSGVHQRPCRRQDGGRTESDMLRLVWHIELGGNPLCGDISLSNETGVAQSQCTIAENAENACAVQNVPLQRSGQAAGGCRIGAPALVAFVVSERAGLARAVQPATLTAYTGFASRRRIEVGAMRFPIRKILP